ncbi:DUF4012 domain-containing protein [Candidatus Falkowbacteria bacterium]|nr:DUF4012 domain-containing protein [Candidatus Falkowbacteria bacterium]
MPKRSTQNKKQVGNSVFSIEKNLSNKPHTPSAHVVNLKKLAHEKEVLAHNKKQSLKHISSDALFVVERKLSKTKNSFTRLVATKSHKKPVTHIAPSQTPLYTVELEGPSLVASIVKQRTKKRFKLPQFTFPPRQSRLPWPTFTLPTLTLPTFSLPPRQSRLPWPKFKRPAVRIPRLQRLAIKGGALFFITALLLTSPLIAYDYYHKTIAIKGRVLGIAHAASDHLKRSKEVFELKDFAGASYELASAKEEFAALSNEIAGLPKSISLIASALPVGENLEAASTLTNIAQILLGLGSDIVSLLDTQSNETITQKLDRIATTLAQHKTQLTQLTQELATINPASLPEQYQSILTQLISYQTTFTTHLDEILSYQKLINTLLGNTSKQRFLLVFQNPNELRATGGFMGSFAQVDIDQGKVTNVWIPTGGIYDLEAGLDTNLTPPQPFTILNDRWEIQDSNYYPDFEKSARNIMWFYEHSGQSTVDGVIALTPNIITQLLALTGPIYISARDQFITAQNFVDVTQHEVEFGEDKTVHAQPKKILADLAPLLLEKLMNLSNQELVHVAQMLHDALGKRDIQLYFSNTELQQFAKDFRWTGNMIDTYGDYLHLSTTNIAGAKSDASISDVVDIEIDASVPGVQRHTLTITRTHTGDPTHPLEGVKHNDYLRIYVPLGSKFISAQGFEPIEGRQSEVVTTLPTELAVIESTATLDQVTQTKIYQEDNRTVFANWIQTDAGETQTIQIIYDTYIESLGDSSAYSLYVQKQAGKQPTPYYTTIDMPRKQEIVWSYPSHNVTSGATITNETMLTNDMLIGVVSSNQP